MCFVPNPARVLFLLTWAIRAGDGKLLTITHEPKLRILLIVLYEIRQNMYNTRYLSDFMTQGHEK